MRPTQLQFRPPDERTAEYDVDIAVTRDGHLLDICEEKQNPKGYTLPQAHRFGGVMGFHDQGTGQSIFCSSASYNAGEMTNKLLAHPGPTITVSALQSLTTLPISVETDLSTRWQRVRYAALNHVWRSNKVRASMGLKRTKKDHEDSQCWSWYTYPSR